MNGFVAESESFFRAFLSSFMNVSLKRATNVKLSSFHPTHRQQRSLTIKMRMFPFLRLRCRVLWRFYGGMKDMERI